MKFKAIIRRDYKKNWETTDLVLELGELAVSYDEGKRVYKVGDGYSSFKDLPEVRTLEELDGFVIKSLTGDELKVVLDPWREE